MQHCANIFCSTTLTLLLFVALSFTLCPHSSSRANCTTRRDHTVFSNPRGNATMVIPANWKTQRQENKTCIWVTPAAAGLRDKLWEHQAPGKLCFIPRMTLCGWEDTWWDAVVWWGLEGKEGNLEENIGQKCKWSKCNGQHYQALLLSITQMLSRRLISRTRERQSRYNLIDRTVLGNWFYYFQ